MDVDKVQEVSAMRAQQLQQEGGIATGDPQASDASQRREAEETRRDILATLLEPAARERLSRIALVNVNLSTQIEALLLRLAQSGGIRGRISDQQLLDLLDQAEASQGKGGGQKKGGIVYQRRKAAFDSDEDDFSGYRTVACSDTPISVKGGVDKISYDYDGDNCEGSLMTKLSSPKCVKNNYGYYDKIECKVNEYVSWSDCRDEKCSICVPTKSIPVPYRLSNLCYPNDVGGSYVMYNCQ